MNEQPDRSLDYVWSLMERNPWAGGNILRGEIPRIYVVTALPTATQENRNQILILAGGAAEADKPCVCIKNDSEGYEWLELTEFTITPSSSTTDLKDAMVAASIITDGGATPLNLDGGALTSGEITCMSVNASSSVLANGTLQAQGGFLHGAGMVRFWNTSGAGQTSKPTITGSKGGNAALASLLSALATYGLVVDSTS